MKLVHDWLGPLELPNTAQRIVSLAPNVTETLFALGLGERLVGRSAFCYRPAGTLGLPVVSSYTRVRWQLLESLQPDLVLISTGVQRELLFELQQRGFPIFPIPLPQSPYGILENIAVLGALLEVTEAATGLCARLSERYSALYKALPPLKVYLEFDLGGPITVGRGSYVGEALRHLGLQNIFADYPQSYFQPDLAEVVHRGPELVIYEPKPHRSRPLEKAQRLLAERGWKYPLGEQARQGSVPKGIVPPGEQARQGSVPKGIVPPGEQARQGSVPKGIVPPGEQARQGSVPKGIVPLVVTGGDELAHYGPLFFDYLEALIEQIRKL